MGLFEDKLFSTYLGKAQAELASLAKEIKSCRKCTLRQNRFEPVPGAGFPLSDILLLKGAPSEEEAKGKVAFYGKVAEAIIKAFSRLKLDVAYVYGTNAVKCLPSRNSKIGQGEIEACSEYLKIEIAISEPKVIVAFGSLSLKALQMISSDVSCKLYLRRGESTNWQGGVTVIFTHDINRALEVSQLKEELWWDLKLLQKIYMGFVSPSRPAGWRAGKHSVS